MSTVSTLSTPGVPHEDRDLDEFLRLLRENFRANLQVHGPHLFRTDARDLYLEFVAYLPHSQQAYNCRACREFVDHYGGLVTLDTRGVSRSALWTILGVPAFFEASVARLKRRVHEAKVTGVFLSEQETWGRPQTGPWRHLSVSPGPSLFTHTTHNPGQAMANRDEDFRDLLRALGDYPREVIAKAATLAASGAISGHEKVALRARWLLELAELRASLRGPARDHATWRAVAGAPPGFCQIRQGLLGMFLDDVAAGKDNAAISRAMAAATGITYQRAQTAPAAQTIERAETLVEQLGLAPSLQRRFARLEEVEALWRHEEPDRGRGQGGVFAHLTPRSAPPSNRVTLPPQTLTWTKFARTVLPLARSIDYLVPPQPRKYGAITTAVDPDAPPILQWDTAQRRNPFSYYTYEHPVPPHRWELTTGHRRVNAICLMPHQWGPDPDAFPNHGRGLFLLLEGARDLRCPELALFPSMLKSELNEVRSVIEAFSKRGTLGGVEQATACGLLLGDGGAWDVRLVVATADTVGEYKLDRLD